MVVMQSPFFCRLLPPHWENGIALRVKPCWGSDVRPTIVRGFAFTIAPPAKWFRERRKSAGRVRQIRDSGLIAVPFLAMLAAMGSGECEILSLPHGPAPVAWRRSTRARRVSLRIDTRGGVVVVTLPPRAARTAGVALLMDHAAWVSARLAALPGATVFADGAVVPLHGRDHVIRHVRNATGAVRAVAGEIRVAGNRALLPARVSEFLRAEARRVLSVHAAAKAAMLAARHGCVLGRVTVKDTRSRWASCTADGNLAFSWRLVMAPRFVQDYVAAHEVAHLRYMDHGPKFWALVRALTPHTDPAVEWLRVHGPRLLRVG
jgi:predicted metal-dependent hydrolase